MYNVRQTHISSHEMSYAHNFSSSLMREKLHVQSQRQSIRNTEHSLEYTHYVVISQLTNPMQLTKYIVGSKQYIQDMYKQNTGAKLVQLT